MIHARVGRDDQEGITTGEAIAGMILNGWGLADRPMSLTPQFFHIPSNLVVDHWTSAVESMLTP